MPLLFEALVFLRPWPEESGSCIHKFEVSKLWFVATGIPHTLLK